MRRKGKGRLRLSSWVLIETETAHVAWLETPPNEARRLTVLASPDLSPGEIAEELRELGGLIDEQVLREAV